jgi:hypothetical protein
MPSTAPHQRIDARRRRLLRTTGAVGAGATAGCASDDGAPQSRGETTGSTTHAATESPTEPAATAQLEAADQPIGVTKGYSTSVDPAEYEDDSAAIQALNDDLLSNLPAGFGQGVVRIPPLKPDGSRWEFSRTVTFGEEDSDLTVVPQGTLWGAGSAVRPWKVTIDDGSPAFYVPGNGTPLMPIGGFAMAGTQGGDCEGIRLADLQLFHLQDLYLIHLAQGPESAGAVVFEGSCFNSEIDRVRYRGYNRDTEASKQTDVFAYVQREDVLGPGELVFGPGCRARFGYGRMLDQRQGTGNPSTYWYGHSERWERDYAMEVHTGMLHLGETTLFGHPTDENEDAGTVNVEGFDGDGRARVATVAQEATLGSPNGKPALRLDGLNQFRVQPFYTYGIDDGPAISVPTAPRQGSYLPNENVIYSGTVDAPDRTEGTVLDRVAGTEQ